MKRLPLLFAIFLGCTNAPLKPTSNKPLLLVSIPPYQTLVQEIAGEAFDVVAVVPPNGDPHSYEPTSLQATTMAKGELWFQIGEAFEKKISPLLTKTKKVDLRQGIPMIGGSCCHSHCHPGEEDRHMWLSPKMLSLQTKTIGAALIERYPEEKGGIEKRVAELQNSLQALDLELKTTVQSTASKTFLVSHPAFAYFCRDYGYEQLSVEQEGKEPLPKELDTLLASALAAHAEVAISMPQHSSRGILKMAEQLQIPTRTIDPYAPDYRETMRSVAQWVAHPDEVQNAR